MIASNYRRFPEAMALQLVLVFGRCTWHTTRPTTRLGRALRAERSRLAKETPQVVRWVAKTVPTWWKLAKRAAQALAKSVKAAMLDLAWDSDHTDGGCDALAELFEQANQFEIEHEDSYRWNVFTTRIRTKSEHATWEHFGVGSGGRMLDDYRC
jgi:hypothetical protein